MVTSSRTAQTLLRRPLVEAGDHLDQATFHERYKAMPPAFRAELIGGVVIVPSPLARGHGVYHALVMTWLGNDWLATPGTLTADPTTTILGERSEPQPDGVLLIEPAAGGQTGLSEDDSTTGPPELIVGVASSSTSLDLHAKRRDYEHAGVLEYVVVVIRQQVIRWFLLQHGSYQEVAPDADGIFRSRVFPGLWLQAHALLQRDGVTVMDVLRQGLATPAHAAFVQQLQERRATS
jgi:Uma2 family endonuclease